jgi:phosphate transport system permease protein
VKTFAANPKREKKRKLLASSFGVISLLIASLTVVILVILISSILAKGGGSLSLDFLRNEYVETKDDPVDSGIYQGIIGTVIMCAICGLAAIPIGIATAIFLEEFRPRNKWLRFFHGFIQLNINNLAGVPSVVYGILGLTAFVYMFNVFGMIDVDKPAQLEVGVNYRYQVKTLAGDFVTYPCQDKNVKKPILEAPIRATNSDGEEFELKIIQPSDPLPTSDSQRAQSVKSNALVSRVAEKSPVFFRLPFGKSIMAAALTLALVILPIVIIASQEAIRAVPDSLRQAAFGMGTNRWQMVRGTVLPTAVPGIMTGAILAMSRAIGEAAPILVIMGAIKADVYTNLMEKATTMPVLIYGMASHSNNGYEKLSAAAIIVLLVVLLMMNSVAIVIRSRFEKKYKLT